MIQRIQTIYMMIVVVLCFVGLIVDLGSYRSGTEYEVAASFTAFTFTTYGQYSEYTSAGPWCLGVLGIAVMLINTLAIMLFRKRMRQLRLLIMTTILLIGYVACYALFAWKYGLALEAAYPAADIQCYLPWVSVFPVVSIILNCLAIHGIRKDEALVRSLDRLR